ncbi:carboxypeptidase, partial [Candidatus Neomarinimicrobiota bacterium]
MYKHILTLTLLVIPLVTDAQSTIDWSAPLPPAPAWDGKSQALLVDADDPWITPSERTGLTATPNYAETMAWLRKLAAAAPEVQLISIGT